MTVRTVPKPPAPPLSPQLQPFPDFIPNDQPNDVFPPAICQHPPEDTLVFAGHCAEQIAAFDPFHTTELEHELVVRVVDCWLCQTPDWQDQSGVWVDGVVKGYVEFPYSSLGSCTMVGAAVCRFYTDTITVTSTRFVLSTGSLTGVLPYGSAMVQIILDGTICGITRSLDSAGGTPHASAACLKRISPGTHTIVTYFLTYDGTSISDTFGARVIY